VHAGAAATGAKARARVNALGVGGAAYIRVAGADSAGTELADVVARKLERNALGIVGSRQIHQ
jgi:hypothetical protein